MTKGVFLAAFGRKGYMYAAFNMAVSIRALNPNIRIAFAYDESLLPWLTPDRIQLFDDLIPIPQSQFKDYGRIDPAKFKTAIYDYLPYDENLILDVDGCCIQDLSRLMDYLSTKDGFYFTDHLGKGKKGEEINYLMWASQDTIWDHFKLSDEQTIYAVQTSFSYVKKNKESKRFFTQLKKNYENGIDKKKVHLWGGTIPDELFYSGTLAQLNIDPSIEIKPVFFGNYFYSGTYQQLHSEFFILSLYGNGIGRTETKLRYLDYYDKLMRGYCRELGYEHIYKVGSIMADKHLNFA